MMDKKDIDQNRLILFFFLFMFLSGSCFADIRDEARESYNLASEKIGLMSEQGYPTLPLLDLLSSAQNNFNNKNYNYSEYLSKQVIVQAEEIIGLRYKLMNLTENMDTLSSFGIETTQLDIKLLYAKSDYEAANINLAKEETEAISKDLIKILSNYSASFFLSMQEYKDSLDDVNGSVIILDEYYLMMKEYYDSKDFSSFLSDYPDLEIIKKIIEENKTYAILKKEVHEKNISFNRADDILLKISDELAVHDYATVLEDYQELNDLASISIETYQGLNDAKNDMEKFDELGLLNKKSEELYNLSLKEYGLENFKDSDKALEDLSKELMQIEKDNLIFQSFNRAKLKKGFKEFIKDHWISLLALCLFIIVTFNFFKNVFLGYFHNKSLMKNSEEIGVLTSLQKSLQKQYFIEKMLDKKNYDSDFKDYEDRKIDLGNKVSMSKLKLHDIEDYFKKINESIKKMPFINRFDIVRLYASLAKISIAVPEKVNNEAKSTN